MTKPTLEAFQASARKALVRVCVSDDILAVFDEKGPSFDFLEDGGVDSLDLVDILHYVEKDLGIRLLFKKLVDDGKSAILGDLYEYIDQDSYTSA